MVVRLAGVLLRARARSAWNRMRRESGLAGRVPTFLAVSLVVLILSVPAALVLKVGMAIGSDLRWGGGGHALKDWTALQALFTLLFPLLGAARFAPAFGRRDIGMHPVPRLALLLGEIPGSLLEVFPLLAAVGIVASHAGLALAVPRAAPAAMAAAVNGLLTMLALQVACGNAWRAARRRPVVGASVGVGLAAAAVWLGRAGLGRVLAAAFPWLPGSQGSAALAAAARGNPSAAAGFAVIAIGTTAALLAVAAWLHHRETMSERSTWRLRRREPAPLPFHAAAVGIARLFVHQVLRTPFGRFSLVYPLLFSAPWAVVLHALRVSPQPFAGIPPIAQPVFSWIGGLPLFGIFLFFVVSIGVDTWTNQFGTDGEAVRTLLVLPVSMRDLVVGRALGLLELFLLQAGIGALPILLVYRPSAVEALWGTAVFGTTFLAAAALGLVFSVRFPRRAGLERSRAAPLAVSWIPNATTTLIAAILVAVTRIAGTPLACVGTFAAAAAAYWLAVPTLAGILERHRERLLGM